MKNKFTAFVCLTASILLLTLSFTLSACTAKPDYLSYVSELRKDLFVGEQDNFCVTVYSGSKEYPPAFDGIKKETRLVLTFKIIQKEEVGEQLTLTFKLGDKEYTCQPKFSPVKSTLSCDVEVASLPEKTLDVQISYGEDCTVTVNTVSKLKENTVSYVDALNKAVEKASSFLKEHTKNGVLNAEIVIRLLCENDVNYYYVGFICEEGLKIAYLIKGETGEIIAEKNSPTKK
jgi:hypothetical protein